MSFNYYGLGDFIKFNNNNIWEIVSEHEGRQITCFKREIGNRVNPFTYKYVINEDSMGFGDEMVRSNNFNYPDWKLFYGEERFRKIATDFSTEVNTTLPLIYFVKYYLGFNDDSKMERIRSTKLRFRK